LVDIFCDFLIFFLDSDTSSSSVIYDGILQKHQTHQKKRPVFVIVLLFFQALHVREKINISVCFFTQILFSDTIF